MGFHEYPEWPASIGTIMGATGPAGATGASGQSLLIPGPRFYVPGENTPVFLTGWHDLSGHGNDGTLTNMSGSTGSGWAGSGTIADPFRLVYDGVNDYVSLPPFNVINSKSFTFESWINTVSPAIGGEELMGETAGGTGSIALLMLDGWIYITGVDDLGAGLISSVSLPATFNDGVWHDVILLFNAGNGTVIVDGNVIPMTSPLIMSSASYSGTNNFIGSSSGGGQFFTGSNGISRIYQFPLDTIMAAKNFAAGPQASAGVWGDGVTPGAVLELVAAYGNAFVGG